jgi:hypothetical protein
MFIPERELRINGKMGEIKRVGKIHQKKKEKRRKKKKEVE